MTSTERFKYRNQKVVAIVEDTGNEHDFTQPYCNPMADELLSH